MPGLHILVERVVERANALGATIDPVAHFGDLLNLHKLACEIKNPPVLTSIDLLDAPIYVGNIAFRRLSWGAQEWLARKASAWWPDDPVMLDLAAAWVLAHSRSKSAMLSVLQKQRAESIIRLWARRTTVSYEAVTAVCQHLLKPVGEPFPLPQRRPETEGETLERHVGTALMTLLMETEQPMDYWVFEAPVEVVDATLENLRSKWRADIDRSARMAGRKVPPDPGSWTVRAQHRFNQAARAFVEKLTADIKPGVGPVKPAVAPAKISNKRSPVNGGEQVQDQTSTVPANHPGGDSEQQEKDRGDGTHVHDLGPTGHEQRSNPIKG